MTVVSKNRDTFVARKIRDQIDGDPLLKAMLFMLADRIAAEQGISIAEARQKARQDLRAYIRANI